MKYSAFLTFIITISINGVFSAELDSVSDDDLVHLIKNEDRLIVLFSKKNCDECDDLETILINLQHDLLENLEAIVVKVFASQMVRLYNPAKEPALVYFRRGIPLLYDGPKNEDVILQKFTDGKEPLAKELADVNFEHLTQASSGATTGDWFVLFYSSDCVECQRLHAIWEAVGVALKNRVNVARVDRLGSGISTAKRFQVTKSPVFILFRKGKFYRYEVAKYDVKSFVSFAQEWYKNARAEKVPVPTSPFDDLVSVSTDYLKSSIHFGSKIVSEHPYIVYFALFGFSLTALTALIAKLKASKKSKDQGKKKAK